jgi:hypothetical protein
MRKRFVKVVLFGALTFAATTSFISCKDYDDDIKRIDNEIGQINQSLTDLKTAIGNNGVKSVTYDAATGKLTIVDSNDKSVSCTIAQNLPNYTIEIKDGKVILKKDGTEVSSATLPTSEVAESFNPTKLTINAAGEILYDGVKTGVTIPKATSSIAAIKKDGVIIGYTVTDNGESSNFYIQDALPLTSLVFVPEAYLSGVEAMRATNLTYDKWTVLSQAVTEKGEIWNAPLAPASKSNITPDMVAYYHVNPVGVTMKQISKLVLSADDKEFVGTRATGFNIANIDLEKCSITDGILKVVFNGNSEAIQKIDASKITVMNLQATVEVNGGTKVVNSDYAAIYKSILKDFVLANPKAEGVHKAHLYGADNANALIGKAEDAITEDPICEVAYNDKNGIDLSKYVETHYTEWTDSDPMKQIGTTDKTIANDKLADYGLKLVYKLSDYYQGDNKTLQSSFFANLKGTVLTAKVGDITEDPIAAVGRMPLVRVELQNASNGEVVNVGWIKVKITRGDVAGTDYPKACGDLKLQCVPETYDLKFDEMNVHIYQKLGLTKEDFHAIYELKSSSTIAGQKVADLKVGEYGTVVELNDADPNVETVCLAWTVTSADQVNAVNNNSGKLIATATYVPKNDKSRADVTITFTATVKTPSASFNTGSKNSEYWYNNMNNIRMNTVVPGVTPNDCSFSVNVDNVFEGNEPKFKLNNEVSDDFKLDKISYQYIFSDKNNNVKVQGNDGATYTLTVAANGKELYANATSLVAKIIGNNVEYQQTAAAKAILNISAHDVAPFTAILDMVLTNKCDMRLPMTDGQFNAEFLRPVNVFANTGKYFVDATDEGYTVKMLDLVYLTDWRDYKFAKGTSASGVEYDGTGYYDYYKVESIVADIANITTNMNGNNIETKKLSEVTNQIVISQANSTVVGDYGTITYKNNGSNVQAFKVKIPVIVTYKWGTVKTAVYMDVQKTEGN